MKKKRKQHKMLRDFYNCVCTPQQLQVLKGGTGGEDSGGESPPEPPKKTAVATGN